MHAEESKHVISRPCLDSINPLDRGNLSCYAEIFPNTQKIRITVTKSVRESEPIINGRLHSKG